MRIDVIGRNLDLTDAIRAFATARADKISQHFEGVQLITVTLTGAPTHGSGEFGAEFVVDVEHHDDFVGHVTDKDLYTGIDRAADKCERQLRDHREKHKLGKH